MKGHYIVVGETREPTWDPELSEQMRFATAPQAAENARERAAEHPGERFLVCQVIAEAEAKVETPAVTIFDLSDPSWERAECSCLPPGAGSTEGLV